MASELNRKRPERVTPRDCFRAAQDSLNDLYSFSDEPMERLWHFLAAAVDWQRRGLEQLAATAEEQRVLGNPKCPECRWALRFTAVEGRWLASCWNPHCDEGIVSASVTRPATLLEPTTDGGDE